MRRLFVVCVVSLIFAASCAKDAITIDGEGISKDLFDYAVKERQADRKASNPEADERDLRKSVADELVAETILVKEAKARNISVTSDEMQKAAAEMRGGRSEKNFKEKLKRSGMSYELFLIRVKNRSFVSKLLDAMVKDDSVTEGQMREFYAQNQLQFLKPAKVFVKIVHLNNEADAQAFVDKIKGKENFDTMAADLGKSGKASTTDYGWLEPGIFSKPIASAMETAKLDTVQGPFNLRDGSFYLFKVKERLAPQAIPFKEAREQIKQILRNQKREKAAAELVDTLKKTTKITINVAL